MLFGQYQQEALKTAIYPPSEAIYYPALGLAGEAGEVANKVKKIFRDDNGEVTVERRSQIRKEMGGVLWYLANLADDLNIDLADVASENMEILQSRQDRGTLKGDGDER